MMGKGKKKRGGGWGREGGGSSTGSASDPQTRRNTDTGSIARYGKGFFLPMDNFR